MAPADSFSAPGGARYESSTMSVGDGTWDFTKNTFLLPNLVGFNFETMQYNGMGNRFATLTQYHTLVLAHGIMAAMVFLFIVPASVMTARFYTGRPGYAITYHAQLNVLAVLMLITVFVLGWFAVGPSRSWTNPHHAIGLAIFVMFLLQIIGGRLVRKIQGRSLRVMIHQWSGRLIALLGIVQIPLGLTLYGSPKVLFILYSLWMAFLILLYFILSYRREGRQETYLSGGRSEGRSRSRVSLSPHRTERTEKGGMGKWLGPLAAGAGIWALFSRRKKKDGSRSGSRSPSRSPSRISRRPEVISSRRESESFIDDEKYSVQDSRRDGKGGGLMKGLLGVAGAFGAAKLVSGLLNRREKRRMDEEYSAVSTETPRRHTPHRQRPAVSEVSEFSEDVRHGGPRSSILAPPGDPAMVAQALSAAEPRRHPNRPVTPRPSHARTRSGYSVDESDYSSYVSPSRRPQEPQSGGGGMGKGILAGLGMGWLAKKMADRRSKQEEGRIKDEEDRRSGTQGSRYTGDGYPSPSRRPSRRPGPGRRPARAATESQLSETSSRFETQPLNSGHGGPPMPPLPAGGVAPVPPYPVPGPRSSHSRSRSRHGASESVLMPSMPPDSTGLLHESDSEAYLSSGGRLERRPSARRRRAGEEAAAAAVASASLLAAEEESRRRASDARRGMSPKQPVSVKVKIHDDRDRNVTLRKLTDEEAAAARRDQRRRRNDSMSSLSGVDAPSGRRWRRDSSQRRAEAAAERMVESPSHMPPLSPPNPAFAAGSSRRPAKDSAYYSGQPGPSGMTPGAAATVSSIGSPDSHGTWSAMSPSPSGPDKITGSAADNRRRRRLERRRSATRPTGADMFD